MMYDKTGVRYKHNRSEELEEKRELLRRDLEQDLAGMTFPQLKEWWVTGLGETWSSLKCFTKKPDAVRECIAEKLMNREYHGSVFRYC